MEYSKQNSIFPEPGGMSFVEFKKIIRRAEARGEIRFSVPLDDYDLAMQWAIDRIGERKGWPCTITIDDIWHELGSVTDDEDRMEILRALARIERGEE